MYRDTHKSLYTVIFFDNARRRKHCTPTPEQRCRRFSRQPSRAIHFHQLQRAKKTNADTSAQIQIQSRTRRYTDTHTHSGSVLRIPISHVGVRFPPLQMQMYIYTHRYTNIYLLHMYRYNKNLWMKSFCAAWAERWASFLGAKSSRGRSAPPDPRPPSLARWQSHYASVQAADTHGILIGGKVSKSEVTLKCGWPVGRRLRIKGSCGGGGASCWRGVWDIWIADGKELVCWLSL